MDPKQPTRSQSEEEFRASSRYELAVDPRRARLADGRPIPIPDPRVGFGDHSELMLLAMLLWGEARGQCLAALYAVGRTVLRRATNKAGWDGRTVKEAILTKWQYSCLNVGDPNRDKLRQPTKHEDPSVWIKCLRVAEDLLTNPNAPDPAPGADHYYDISLDQIGKPPAWARQFELVRQIGRLKFYKSNAA